MGEVGDGFNVAKKMRDGGNFEMAEYSPQQSIFIISSSIFIYLAVCPLLNDFHLDTNDSTEILIAAV